MNAVIADASPLNYLILIGKAGILPQLFDRIILPKTVLEELLRSAAPDGVRRWAASPPSWAEVIAARSLIADLRLHPGETEAISLALELHIPSILLDDREARTRAKELGLHAIGLLAVLADAHELNLLEFGEAIESLKSTSFRMSPALIQAIRANLRR